MYGSEQTLKSPLIQEFYAQTGTNICRPAIGEQLIKDCVFIKPKLNTTLQKALLCIKKAN